MKIKGKDLKTFREKYNLTQSDLAKMLGMSLRTVQDYENKNQIPEKKREFLHNILITKAADMQNISEPEPTYEATPVITNNIMMTPLVTVRAQAGFLSGYGDKEYMDDLPQVPWEVDREYKGNYLTFEVSGDSMESADDPQDSIYEDDQLLVREIQRHHWRDKLHFWKYDFVIAHRDKGVVVKRVIKHDEDKGIITCHSLNSFYEDYDLHLDDVQAIYNIIQIKRKRRRR